MMRLELVKRPQHSMLFSALSPFIAFGLTIIAGAILFALLGNNPLMRSILFHRADHGLASELAVA